MQYAYREQAATGRLTHTFHIRVSAITDTPVRIILINGRLYMMSLMRAIIADDW